MTSGAVTSTRRPGGRSARVRDAVFTAVGQLVGRGERETMTVPQVAELAGVNPTSIYRRWGSVEALLEQVAIAALTRDEPLPDTGSIAGDLRAWAEAIAADIFRDERIAYLRAMVAARSGRVESCPCSDQRLRQVTAFAERARERGERAPSPEQVMNHVVAPLYYRAVFGIIPGPGFTTDLVDEVLALAPAR